MTDEHISLLVRFAACIESAFPKDAPRDRFGRFNGPRNTGPLQDLAVELAQKHRDLIRGGGRDTQEHAGMVARALLREIAPTSDLL